MSPIDRLTQVFNRRWTVPVMQILWTDKGAKFVTLVHRLGASPGAVRDTLEDLLKWNWIVKNPGYGHPMRPEYVLTKRGQKMAEECDRLLQKLAKSDLSELHKSKWALAVILVLADGELRFSELRSELTSITDRSLALCLKNLSDMDCVVRRVEDSFPPSVAYSLAGSGKDLVATLRRFTAAIP